jgi:hypothetical protein
MHTKSGRRLVVPAAIILAATLLIGDAAIEAADANAGDPIVSESVRRKVRLANANLHKRIGFGFKAAQSGEVSIEHFREQYGTANGAPISPLADGVHVARQLADAPAGTNGDTVLVVRNALSASVTRPIAYRRTKGQWVRVEPTDHTMGTFGTDIDPERVAEMAADVLTAPDSVDLQRREYRRRLTMPDGTEQVILVRRDADGSIRTVAPEHPDAPPPKSLRLAEVKGVLTARNGASMQTLDDLAATGAPGNAVGNIFGARRITLGPGDSHHYVGLPATRDGKAPNVEFAESAEKLSKRGGAFGVVPILAHSDGTWTGRAYSFTAGAWHEESVLRTFFPTSWSPSKVIAAAKHALGGYVMDEFGDYQVRFTEYEGISAAVIAWKRPNGELLITDTGV